jgi:hypothetical protein
MEGWDGCGWLSGGRAKGALRSIWHGSRMTLCMRGASRILVGRTTDGATGLRGFVRWSLGAETFNLLPTKHEAVSPGRKDENEAGRYAEG